MGGHCATSVVTEEGSTAKSGSETQQPYFWGGHAKFHALLLGDSITEWGRVVIDSPTQSGWASRLDNDFARTVNISNFGATGYNTRHALATLDYVLPSTAQKLLFATVWYGANDAASNENQYVPVEEYAANLKTIITRIKGHMLDDFGSTIVVLGPPPVDSSKWKDRSNEQMETYSQVAKAAAEAEGVSFVDVYKGFLDTGKWSTMTIDGLHPNAAGQQWVYDAIKAKLPEKWKVWPRSIPQDFPFNDDLDPADPAKSLTWQAVSKLTYPVRAYTKA